MKLLLAVCIILALCSCSTIDNKKFEQDSNDCFYKADMQECMKAKGWYK